MFVDLILMYNKVLRVIYVRSMLYAYTSKELYILCSYKVMRYKPACFVIAVAAGAAVDAAAAVLHRLVCVYGYDFSGGCDCPRF